MNENQKIHLEYGRKMLEGKQKAQDYYDRTQSHDDKWFGEWLVENRLDVDPLTGRKVFGPVRAACIWAAQDIERFEGYVKKFPRSVTVRSLHERYKAEQNGADTDPSVYIYRMRGPLSGEILEPQICKIGCADNGAAARVDAQSKKAAVGYIPEIERVLKCKEPKRLENLLHKKFMNRQVKVPGREWFEVSLEDVEDALQEFERDGRLWRDGGWIRWGRRPEPKAKKPRNWSKDKSAAHLIYKKVLPGLISMSDDPSCLDSLSEQTGLNVSEIKAGLQWLIKHGYLTKWEGGMLAPSEKFNEHWQRRQNKGTE